MLLTIGRVFDFENNNVCVGASNDVIHSDIDCIRIRHIYVLSVNLFCGYTIVRDMAHKYFAFLLYISSINGALIRGNSFGHKFNGKTNDEYTLNEVFSLYINHLNAE